MKYSFESKVRFSEIGENKKLTLNSIINYFQDCTNFHSESVGGGMEYEIQKKRGWILSSWQICVKRYPGMGEDIVITTWPYDFKGFYGSRNFTIESKAGELLAYANSLWIYVNTETGAPTKIEPEEAAHYECEEKFDMNYAPRKVPMIKGSVPAESFVIKRHQLDFNHHVNNGQYIQLAEDYLPEGFEIHQMRAEYKKQAVLDCVVTPMVYNEGKKVTIALCGDDGNPYAVVEFQ